jgi:hypothetical protein
MTEFCLLAPGPSASIEVSDFIRRSGKRCGVISSAWTLAPWAEFIAAADNQWWIKNPEALSFAGSKFASHQVRKTQKVDVPPGSNSGVLGLECCVKLGATVVYLFGFDMKGTHFFGPYTNGLKNTTESRRKIHLKQFATWGKRNKSVKVFNCTKNSAISCFEFIDEIAIQN